MAHRDFTFSVSMVAGKVQHLFLQTVVSLLKVYLVDGQSTSVELHILATHLHRGKAAYARSAAQGHE